ncbi:ENHANCER OF AG-4 protein 2-like [Prunus yedoensis var. nudiflora]|uniref:ENHANCER OF AG-4 protein 2-like n=1 Tax=Prunus yedoensis var. nudiflora TaxID=2094558 RepID=A0A314UXD1_PRUYE|nr:ENHANCER OF AG-4 protein 2-like [Prunus yedoensis var. nudiflora]
MAPGRRRGANKAKAKRQLSLGDLVLAKVKGFPYWPAKISRPEDWKKVLDPKKRDARLVAFAEKLAAGGRTESEKLMADYKNHMVELEVVSDTTVEALQCAFNDAIDDMIPKMHNLADKLNDLRLRQARRAKTRRASSRVTGLV